MSEPNLESKLPLTPDSETEELSLDQLQQASGGIAMGGESANRVTGVSTGRVDGETEGRVEKTSTGVQHFGWDLTKNRGA